MMQSGKKYLTVDDFDGDSVALSICEANFSTDGSGHVTAEDLAIVNNSMFGMKFRQSSITKLGWIKYFANLTSLPYGAFTYCNSLIADELIRWPANIISIGDYCFYSCSNLKLNSLPENIRQIGSSSFEKCNNLVLSNLPDSIESLGDNVFTKCYNLTINKLPNKITIIPQLAFLSCGNITISSIPNTVISIYSQAFAMCESITSLTIPEGLISIKGNAFLRCYSLRDCVLPSTITEIGSGAFFYSAYNSLTCYALQPPSIGGDNFTNTQHIYVPAESVSLYTNPDSTISKGWYQYASKISAIPT